MLEQTEICNPTVAEVKKDIRVEDKIKLRELELSTQYQIKYLSDSFNDLRKYVERKLDTEADRFEKLNKKVNWLIILMLTVVAGVDPNMLLSLLTKFAM